MNLSNDPQVAARQQLCLLTSVTNTPGLTFETSMVWWTNMQARYGTEPWYLACLSLK